MESEGTFSCDFAYTKLIKQICMLYVYQNEIEDKYKGKNMGEDDSYLL